MPAVLGVSLDQGPKVLAKGKGKTVSLPCKASGLSSSDYIHWYQIKDGEAPSRLLFISQGEIPAAVLGLSVDQGQKVLVKGKGKTVFLPCKATDMGSSDYIHWYQIKDGKAPSRLLHISQGAAVLGVSLVQDSKVLVKGKTKTVYLPCKATGLGSSDYIHWYQMIDGKAPTRLLYIKIPAAVLGVSLVQDPKVLVKVKGKTVFLPCKATGVGSSDYIHWYQMIDGKAPTRLLYINMIVVTCWLLYKRHCKCNNLSDAEVMQLYAFKSYIAQGLCKSGKSLEKKRGWPSGGISSDYGTRKRQGPTAPIPIPDVRLDATAHWIIMSEKKGSYRVPGCKG
ncbi:T-cell receptor [Labeo rohita]|nr:T-cell receptor [Labeo rohita]